MVGGSRSGGGVSWRRRGRHGVDGRATGGGISEQPGRRWRRRWSTRGDSDIGQAMADERRGPGAVPSRVKGVLGPTGRRVVGLVMGMGTTTATVAVGRGRGIGSRGGGGLNFF
jgi:hypothetical protein